MSFSAEQLYDLLPAVHRNRDAEQGYPLRQMISIIAGQVAVLEEHLEQLYDNHFVETAAPWALPYLGDLLGIRGLLTGTTSRSPRAEVGHTVAYRRRKGTAPMLELLARDVTGWPARAVEFFERLAMTQHLNHQRPLCQSFASLRNASDLEHVGTPFERLQRTVEVRRIEPGRGRWNIPNVALSLWRLRSYARTGFPLVPVEELWSGDPLAGRRFRVHPLGLDSQLFLRPVTEDDVTHLAEPINVPLPMTRRMLTSNVELSSPTKTLYGPGLSLLLQEFVEGEFRFIPAERIIVCDLSDALNLTSQPVWNHENKATESQVALDPVLGRIVFGKAPAADVPSPRVTWHYGFSFDLGGGEYRRGSALEADPPVTAQVPPVAGSSLPGFDTLSDALSDSGSVSRTIEITNNGRIVESLPAVNAEDTAIAIRAADGSCPVVWLQPDEAGTPWTIRGNSNGSVSLNGLWFAGSLRIEEELGRFTMRHCTLAPGRGVTADGKIIAASGASLKIDSLRTHVVLENCILPSLQVGTNTVQVTLRNCIIDAGGVNDFALSNLTADGPAGSWRLENCTIIGSVAIETLELASNCVFFSSSVFVQQRQKGCVRFSWLPSAARTPRRYRSLPAMSDADTDIHPRFASLRFGDPAYAQLSLRCPKAIRIGADDGAELGAFHDLFQPQREAHLRARLAESLRFGLETGVYYES